MILNNAQAEAVYAAMCALNNVNGCVTAEFPVEGVQVVEFDDGSIAVKRDQRIVVEAYENQSDFAAAYGLDHGGADLASELARPLTQPPCPTGASPNSLARRAAE